MKPHVARARFRLNCTGALLSTSTRVVLAGTDCGLGGCVHPQIAWAKLRSIAEGADLATRQFWGQAARASSD
jgi:methionine synthase II (cobalamin-independent)